MTEFLFFMLMIASAGQIRADYQGQVRSEVEKWQARLSLQEWRIRVVFNDNLLDSLGSPEALGMSIIDPDYRRALILIRSKKINKTKPAEIVVHELLHVRLADLVTLVEACADNPRMLRAIDSQHEKLAELLMRALVQK